LTAEGPVDESHRGFVPKPYHRLQRAGRRAAGTIRRDSEQLAAVPPGREIEPASASPEKAALVCEAEQVGCLRQRKVQPTEVLLGELAARIVEQFGEEVASASRRRCSVRSLKRSSPATWSRRGSPSGSRRMITSRAR
jgi:hypothetical protein